MENREIEIITGNEITREDIEGAVLLDSMAYDEIYRVDSAHCLEWLRINPDIYIIAKDTVTGQIVAYVNVSPVTEECYEKLRDGKFVDAAITPEMLRPYDTPSDYSLCFSSVVIHPNYRNAALFTRLLRATVNVFVGLAERGVFVRRILADAVTERGEKFCRLTGMRCVHGSDRGSTLYELTLIPPSPEIKSGWSRILSATYRKHREGRVDNSNNRDKTI